MTYEFLTSVQHVPLPRSPLPGSYNNSSTGVKSLLQYQLIPVANSSAVHREDERAGGGRPIALRNNRRQKSVETTRAPTRWVLLESVNRYSLPLGPSLMTILKPSSSPSCFATIFAAYRRLPRTSTCLSSAWKQAQQCITVTVHYLCISICAKNLESLNKS